MPFAHVVLAEDATQAQALAGGKVALRAVPGFGGCDYKLVDIEKLSFVRSSSRLGARATVRDPSCCGYYSIELKDECSLIFLDQRELVSNDRVVSPRGQQYLLPQIRGCYLLEAW